jgi:tRNA (cmo5U34)-methyltransferase
MLPFYPDMHRTMAGLINKKRKDVFDILEPGFGTGNLTLVLKRTFPHARILGIDNNKSNIKKALHKLGKFFKFQYVIGDFEKVQLRKKFDVVITALSVHHLSGREKKKYFLNVFNMLRPDGKLIIGDMVKSPEEQQWHKLLVRTMGEEGEYRWRVHKSNRNDKPSKIEEQLRWLRDAGFKRVSVAKKWFNFYVFSGEKQ